MTEQEVTSELRSIINCHIKERLDAKLGNIKIDDPRRAKLEQKYKPSTWLADAARRVAQLQLATHTLKPLHPDARGSNLHAVPPDPGEGLLSTHSVSSDLDNDVVGNAAALDVYKFLNLIVGERSLLALARARDSNFLKALSNDAEQAEQWRAAFAAIAENTGKPASHHLAKQVYFPLPDGGYHLLAPLFPSSLAHAVQNRIREDRFGDAAKAARQARAHGKHHPHGFREYPNLAIQKFGGTKPQNISQLNSERHGENWLLSSLPPTWRSQSVRAPLGVSSIFDKVFDRQASVLELTWTLKKFLETERRNNIAIRQRRTALVESICDEAHLYAARLRELPPGWSSDDHCKLHVSEQLWLDPLRGHNDPEFMKLRLQGEWQADVCQRFANWLNARLKSKKLALGDAEHKQWATDLNQELKMFRDVLEDPYAAA